MNIDKYTIFLKVVEAGSITLAAQQLGYTQSGVSHVVNSLEEEFGFPLLIRRKSGVTLTDEAQRLLPDMQEVVLSNERLSQTVSAISGVTTGAIRVGTFSSVAVQWIPSLLKGFQQQYPLVELQLYNGSYTQLAARIAGKRLDCAFASRAVQGEHQFVPLHQDPLVLLLPPGHPLEGRKSVPLSALKEEPLILPGEGADYDIGAVLRSAGLLQCVRYALNDDFAALALVEHGLGCCIMPSLLLKNQSHRCTTAALEPPQARTIGLMFPSNRRLSPACRAFLQFSQDWIAKMA